MPRLKVLKETKTGANKRFQDTKTKETFTKREVVRHVKNGEYEKYHVVKRGNNEFIRSNPDGKEKNNLG